MTDKIIKTLVILIFCSGAAFASRTVPLPGLINPDSITVDKNRIYITDGAAISIYSREDFKLIKKFGKKGEGPREFKVAMGATAKLKISVQPDQIIVNSIGRVSFFTKDGNYIKEINVPTGNNFIPLGNGFVGYATTRDNKILYLLINLYDADLKKIKEIFRKEYYFQANKRMNLIKLGCANKRRAVYSVCRNKLLVEGENDIIHVFDEKGEKKRDIKQDYEKLKIPETRKAEIMDDIYTLFTGQVVRKIIKEKGYFPDRFPARIFTTADDKIYIPTYMNNEGKNEFIIFDIDGKLLKKVYVPFKAQQFLLPYPYTVKDGTLFQLVENDETEEWELHINSF
jgi:hypothetical protein